MRRLFSFPNPVDDRAARTVAAGVVALAVTTLATGQHWLVFVLLYGFVARVLSGPTLSPLGLLATRVLVPRYPGTARLRPGPPKRFAQGLGVAFSLAAAVLWFGFGLGAAGAVALLMLTTAATLEAAFGLCLGCKGFALLMKLRVIPESVCEECADLSRRYPELANVA